METRGAGTSVVNSLHQAHQQLSMMIRKYFSDYANQNLLWKTNQAQSVKPISPNDPYSVEFAKRCLLILQEAKELARRYAEYQEFKGTDSQFIMKLSLDAIDSRSLENQNAEKKEVEMTPDQESTLNLFHSLKSHFSALAGMAKKSNFPGAQQVSDLAGTLRSASVQALFSQAQDKFKENFNNLSQLLSDFMVFYFNTDRPLAYQEPEQEYEIPNEIEFKALTSKPKDFKDFKPNSYVLIKEKDQWEVYYLDDKNLEYKVDWVDVWGLKKLLRKKSPDNLTVEDHQRIKKILSVRWNPSAQERTEWFLLVEPVRSVMNGTQKIYDLFDHFIQESKKQGVVLDSEQVELIEKTKRALQESKVDAKGYYQYLDEDEETPISQSLKGIYNIIWSINQLSRGYWENPGILNQINAADIGLKALGHYWKIQWPLLGGQLGALYDQMINAFLVYGKQMTFPLLDQLARTTRRVEMQHHLRYGVLTEGLRPLFDDLETMYVERGFDFSNPFKFTQEDKEKLEVELKSAQGRVNEIKQKLILPRLIAEHLAFYKEFSPLIDKPDTLFRSMVRTQFPLEVKIQECVVLLLTELALLRKDNRFPEQVLAALDKLENRLISDLTLDKKHELLNTLNSDDSDEPDDPLSIKLRKVIAENEKKKNEWEGKSYARRAREIAGAVATEVVRLPSKPWQRRQSAPIVELEIVSDFISEINKSLEDQLLNTTKYKEAIKYHASMGSEYACRALRNHGLNGLLRAVEVAKDIPDMNIKQKRKLVAILSDLKGEASVNSEADVHRLAVQFVNNPAAIKSMIENLPADIRHSLAIETTLTGHVTGIGSDILYSEDQEVVRKDLGNVLDRVETSQLLGLISEIKIGDEAAIDRVALFKVLINGSPISASSLGKAREEIKAKGINKDSLIEGLVSRYKSLERESSEEARNLKHKIGLFLGRIALADKEIATTVFRGYPDAKKCIWDECLDKNPSLYYESLSNILLFNYVNGKHERENRSYKEFLTNNELVVKDLHAAIYNDHKMEVSDYYQDPWRLCSLIHEFYKKVSPGSNAEKSIKEFFSALVLCRDISFVRERIVDAQSHTKGSKYSGYMQLLTIPASYEFWEKAWNDLLEKQKVLQRLREKEVNLSELLKDLNDKDRDEIMKEMKSFFIEQEKGIKAVPKNIPDKKDFVIHSKFLHQELKQIDKNVDERFQSWENKIAKLKKQSALRDLKNQVDRIIKILKRYVKDREGFVAHLSLVRKAKLKLAKDYIIQFKSVRKALADNNDASYKAYADQITDLVAGLNEAHRKIIKDEVKEEPSQEALKNKDKSESPKKSLGRFGEITNSMTIILSRLNLVSKSDKKLEESALVAAPEDDFEKRLTKIGKIILTIQKKLSFLVASSKKLSSQPEMKRSGKA